MLFMLTYLRITFSGQTQKNKINFTVLKIHYGGFLWLLFLTSLCFSIVDTTITHFCTATFGNFSIIALYAWIEMIHLCDYCSSLIINSMKTNTYRICIPGAQHEVCTRIDLQNVAIITAICIT